MMMLRSSHFDPAPSNGSCVAHSQPKDPPKQRFGTLSNALGTGANRQVRSGKREKEKPPGRQGRQASPHSPTLVVWSSAGDPGVLAVKSSRNPSIASIAPKHGCRPVGVRPHGARSNGGEPHRLPRRRQCTRPPLRAQSLDKQKPRRNFIKPLSRTRGAVPRARGI